MAQEIVHTCPTCDLPLFSEYSSCEKCRVSDPAWQEAQRERETEMFEPDFDFDLE